MTMPVFTNDEYPRAREWRQITDQVDSLTAPTWTRYTPTWTSSATQPDIANGSISGRYRRAADEDLILVEFEIVMGSATTYGTGIYIFSLPVEAHSSAYLVGYGNVADFGTTERFISCRKNGTTSLVLMSDAGAVAQTVPHTWATADQIRIALMYRPA